MAASSGDTSGRNGQQKITDCVIFILNSKIQKARLMHMKKNSRKNGFIVEENYSSNVTHIVTVLESWDQVIRSLKKSQPSMNVEGISSHCHLVKLEWFSACLERGSLVDVQDHHRLIAGKKFAPALEERITEDPYNNAKYCCQRVTPLNSPNKKYCDGLEVLEEHAEYRGGDHQLSRALAFRKASAALRAYPKPIRRMEDIDQLYDLKGGKHSKKVIQDILEDGFSTEVETIQQGEWFRAMKYLLSAQSDRLREAARLECWYYTQLLIRYTSNHIFTGIFGCGSATARKWYEKGHRSLDDIKRLEGSNLTIEQQKGLEHYNDLNAQVTRDEAMRIHAIVRREAEQILPGCTVVMTGGFIRGKDSGHDVDFLISHPEEGAERGLLPKLLHNLRDYLLYTDVQRNTYGEAPSLGKRQNTMDHFERCFSIFRLPVTEAFPTSGSRKDPSGDGNFEEPSRKRVKMALDCSSSTNDNESNSKPWVARRVDLVVTPASQHAFALMGWTGSRMFCRSIRDYAGREKNMVLTSHGLYDKINNRSLGAKTERDIFEHLGLPYREPQERNC